MTLDWTTIITTVISCGVLITGYEAIRDRKANKKIKSADAVKAEADAQKVSMNLSELYLEKVLAITETSAGNQKEMIIKLDTLIEHDQKQDIKLSNIEEYLNGEYHSWLGKKEEMEKEDATY